MDPAYSRCVQKVFVELYKKGLIYRGKRMVNWDPAARTALSDEEVEMIEEDSFMWLIRYPLLDPAGRLDARAFVQVATTRPETMLGDEAVAVNPHDDRYRHLIGRKALLPICNKQIPIIADELVDREFGTGCVKVTPAHDPADYEMAIRHRLPLTVVIGPDGKMTGDAGEGFAGLDRFEARKAVVEKLKAERLLVGLMEHRHNVGYSQRSHVPIEPYLSEQWFLRYPSVEPSTGCVELGVVQDKTIRVVDLTGKELRGVDRAELRDAAKKLAQSQGWIGKSFHNDDTGWEIFVRRRTLAHAFINRQAAAIQAIAVLPELIQTAALWYSEPHDPPNPRFRQVHHFVGALNVGRELYCIPMTVKELADGRMLYDHKARKAALGGKPLVAHLPREKLGIQPAPIAAIKLADLLAEVNPPVKGAIRFHPDRWGKTYTHWMHNLKDWCISRQLWWGHRIPVWQLRRGLAGGDRQRAEQLLREAEGRYPNLIRVELNATPWNDTSTREMGLPPGRFVTIEVCVSPELESLTKELEALGFVQDPDVLDTWFSSWLWPFATMGWPEQTATLKKFYPTTDLVTGPDIIFFWVARMIMAGYEFMGDLPFRNVYFTGIIRDKLGRKMSKSLGNSPDPLELIAKYGADALRFGTMRSAPLGQDVLFDEKDVELGRNFCNKLWNACRFRQMQGGQVQGEIVPALLTGDDKWILLKLDQAVREITTAFAEYRFNEATQTLYRFFWSEYCDWYVEASKAVLSTQHPSSVAALRRVDATRTPDQDTRRANTLAVIDFVLSHTLRLFHPFLPFITEELWHGMGYHEDMPANQGGQTIMFAPWPKPLDDDFRSHYGLDGGCLEAVNARYDLVTQGRNLRREGNIPANKKVKFVFKPVQQVSPHDAEVLKLLLNAEGLELDPAHQPKKGTPMVHSDLGDLYLPMEGLTDVAAEKARLSKELNKAEGEITKAEQKLKNPNFTSKAPPHVLQEHQQRLAEWQAKRDRVKKALEALQN
jgi:valyl-tRNA synthetase